MRGKSAKCKSESFWILSKLLSCQALKVLVDGKRGKDRPGIHPSVKPDAQHISQRLHAARMMKTKI